MEKEIIEEVILELGQIIEIEAPANGEIHKKNFIIDYLDNNLIKLINLDDYSLLELKLNNKKIIDETIEKIIIKLPHPVEKGYAKQNGLIAPKWFSFHFDDGKGIKEVIKGQIINNFEDRIEIRTYPNDEIIFIDFGYKGIPLDLPIIQIKPYIKPKTKEEAELERKMEEEENFPELDDQEELIEKEFDPNMIEDIVTQELGDADELEKLLGENKEIDILIKTEVAEEEKRYSIDLQKDDLSTSLLKFIKPEMRTRRVMKNVHTIINRFIELREKFSVFNEQGYPTSKLNYLVKNIPLKNHILKLDRNLRWIIPIVKSKKKIYDIGDLKVSDINDVEPLLYAHDLSQEMDLNSKFKKNNIPDEENKYKFFIRQLNRLYIPRKNVKMSNDKAVIMSKEVNTDTETIVDNIGSFISSSFNNGQFDTTKFDIDRYLTAPTMFELEDIENKDFIGIRKELTESEIINIRGYLVMPYQYRELCKKFLPCVNILKKSLLNLHTCQPSNILRNPNVNSNIFLPSSDPYTYHHQFRGARAQINDIQTYLFSKPNFEDYITSRYSEAFLPNISEIIDLHEEKMRFDTKIRIKNGLTVEKMIEYLETYGIYHYNINDEVYYKLGRFVDDNIDFYKKTIDSEISNYNKFLTSNIVKYDTQPFINILSEAKQNIKDQIFELYDLNTNYENIIKLDGGKVYMDFVSLLSIDLIQTIDIDSEVEKAIKETKDIVNEKVVDDSDCKSQRLVLAKRYVDIDELKQDDNDTDIYFDKKYDETRYSIMKSFKSDKDILPAKELLNKIKLHLINNVGVSVENADRDALAMIEGKKRVINGDYAILDEGDLNYKYYERRNDKWRIDDKLTGKTLDDITFCNIDKKCLNINKNCTSLDSGRETIKKKLLKQIVEKFEDEYETSITDLKKHIQERAVIGLENLKQKKLFNEKHFVRYDIQKNRLSRDVKFPEIQTSEHSKIRDRILSENDVILKYTYLQRFINLFCRKPIEKENEWWYYDSTTELSIPILPIFYEKIVNANAWTYNMNMHNEIVAEVASEFGESSSSGDYIVCKYTGFYIRSIELETDEGYTKEGFKIVTKSEMTDEYTIKSNVKDEVKLKKTETAIKIQKIILSLDKNLHIDSRNSHNFIIKHAEEFIVKNAKRTKKEKYEGKIGRKKREDETFLNTIIIYTVLSMYIIGIQTNIPNIVSRRSFPGCAESFTGFPLINGSDYSTINYIACVALKMRGNIRDGPWSIIPKNNSKTFNKHLIDVQKILKGMINKLIQEPLIKDKFLEKNNWLLENKESLIDVDNFDMIEWYNFLPPLQIVKPKHLPNISSEFEKKLIKEIQSLSDMQFEYLWSLKGKMKSFTFSILESLQNIINQQPIILESLNGEAYLENACCNDNMEPFYNYFALKEKSIYRENEYVENISKIYNKYTYLSLPSMMYNSENTHLIYPLLNDDFTENTIYLAYIKYCKFYSKDIISKDLLALCNDNKNVEISVFDDIGEKIEKMKKKSHNYTSDSLKVLMNLIHKKNIINFTISTPGKSPLQEFRELYLTDIYDETIDDMCIIDKELYKTIGELTDRFEVNFTENDDILVNELKAIIDDKCEQMKEDIVYFLNGKLKLKPITDLIDNYLFWNEGGVNNCIVKDDEKGHNIFMFTKNVVTNILKIYPSIIINNQIKEYENQKPNDPQAFVHNLNAPKHWRLEYGEGSHSEEVAKIIKNEYTNNGFDFKDFFDNAVLDDFLKNIMERSKKLLDFLEHIPFYSKTIVNNIEYKTIFDGDVISRLSKFIFLCSIELYISIFDSYKLINIDERLIEDKTEAGLILELEKKIINLINVYVLKTTKDKKLINKSSESIKQKVLLRKRQENAKFTKKFEQLPESEKDTENELKKHKLGDWAIGLSSKIFRYDAEQYDRERQERERDKELELRAGSNKIGNNVDNTEKSQMINDMVSDLRNETDIQERIDADVYQITYTGECEDNDQFEEDTDQFY